jgi:hypothetical protein
VHPYSAPVKLLRQKATGATAPAAPVVPASLILDSFTAIIQKANYKLNYKNYPNIKYL